MTDLWDPVRRAGVQIFTPRELDELAHLRR